MNQLLNAPLKIFSVRILEHLTDKKVINKVVTENGQTTRKIEYVNSTENDWPKIEN